MENHPIEGLMLTAMSSIENMIDVNTIIGEPIETSNNIVIIPISKVCFGFAAGGSEFKGETIDEYTKKDKDEKVQYRLPFGGGSGATVSINPIAFLIVEEGKVRLLPVNHSSCIDKILDYVPDLFEKLNKSNLKSELKNKKEQDEKNNIEIKKEHVNNKKAHINKVPKTTEEKFEYIPKKIKQEENKEIADEMEDLFDDEFEYDDD
jgi:sporulation protein YtfJ